MNAKQYVNQAKDLFILSDSFLRIKELIDDDSSTIDDIADIIVLDPALAASILKLANSSLFNYPGKIDTISKAVLILGITEIYNLVIAYFTAEAFKSIDANAQYLDNFWLKSVDCALLIKFFGRHLCVPNVERLFILGLLHNLGELVVMQISPEKVSQCDSDSVAHLPWYKQQKFLGFSYAECTAELLKGWQFPYSLFAPIRNQDQNNLSDYSIETQLLYVAKRVMNNNVTFKESDYAALLSEQQLKLLNLDSEVLAAAKDYCDLERFDVLSTLNPCASTVY